MRADIAEQDSTIIRAWPDEDERKMVIQIEDAAGEVLAHIALSLDKASDLADWIAIYVAQLRKSAIPEDKADAPGLRPALLC